MMKRQPWKMRILTTLLAASMMLSYVPLPTHAEEVGGLCEHHTAHTADCGYVASVSGSDCTYHCHICHVQDLVDALPDNVSAENVEAVTAQLATIDSKKASLYDEELAQVDFAKYTAAISAINELADQSGTQEAVAVDTSDFQISDGVLVKYYGTDENVVIPDGVTVIGASAFANNVYISYVKIPNSVTTIEKFAFSSARFLVSVNIPSSVTSIGDRAFYNTSITYLDLPDSLTSIGKQAFYQTGLVELGFYNTGNRADLAIGEEAFLSLDNLQKVSLASVSNIGAKAFGGCNNLTELEYFGTTTPTFTGTSFAGAKFNEVYVTDDYTGASTFYNKPVSVRYYTLTTCVEPVKGGYIRRTGPGSSYPGKGLVGETITLIADLRPGYNFVGWKSEGETIGTDLKYSFVMPAQAVSYTAAFEKNHTCDHTTYTDAGDGTHSYQCSICGTNTEVHSFGTDNTCIVCGAICKHESYTDGTCTACGVVCEHSFGTDGICTVCGGYEPAVLNDTLYEIGNAGQLFWFAELVNEGSTSASAVLTADIAIPDGMNWTPIGNTSQPYRGTFNGGGHTISGLSFGDDSVNHVGLFGIVESTGKVRDTGLVKTSIIANNYVGTIAGFSIGTVERCWAEDITVSGAANMGGLVGLNRGTVNNCWVSGDVTMTNASYSAGGIVGYNYGSVSNCFSLATVTGTAQQGALIGTINKHESLSTAGSITNCYYDSSKSAEAVGNIVDGTVTDVSSKTTEAFASGEVVYLLGEAWGQTIGTEEFPTLGGNTVYKVLDCDGTTELYSNTNENKPHNFGENGFCSNCDAYEPAVLNGEWYEIGSAGQLYWFAQQVNSGNGNINGKLTADIVVNENVLAADGSLNEGDFRPWIMMGDPNHYLSGTFDGQGHTVSGLYCDHSAATDYITPAFITNVVGGTVRNVGLVDSYILSGWNYAGGAVGSSHKGTVENCWNGATVIAANGAGGIVGCAGTDTTVSNCYNTGTIISNERDAAGILVVAGGGITVKNCYNTGTVQGAESSNPIADDGLTLENSYYLAESETDSHDGTTFKTAEAFASGQVAWLLQADQQSHIWGQTCGTGLPALGGLRVYEGYADCQDTGFVYSNDPETLSGTPISHTYVNGFCTNTLIEGTLCGAYQEAQIVDGVYQIGNAGQLFWFAQQVNAGNKGANAVLTEDIDLEGRNWTPICSTGLYYNTTEYADTGYTGTFDGQGHVISNLTVTGSAELDASYGLFGTLSGTVKNLGIRTFTYTGAGMDSRVGPVVGQMLCGSLVENCFAVNVNINTQVNTQNGVAGGIAGCNYAGIVRNCFTDNVTITAGRYGGILGDNCADGNNSDGTDRPGTMDNCYTSHIYLGDPAMLGNAPSGEAGVSAEWFASGEIAYLLGEAFGQNIDNGGENEGYPVFSDATVYKVLDCDGTTELYSNTNENKPHSFDENGFCSNCDAYEPAVLNGDVYEISNAGQLYWFAAKVNGGETAINGKLMKDIVVNEGTMTAETTGARAWTPIGNSNAKYAGTFDGNEKNVSGLYFNDAAINYVGLFGWVKGSGEIQNVGVVNFYFHGNNWVGGVIGRSNYGTTVTGCYSTGTVSGKSNVGGVTAYNYQGTVTNCYSTGSVTGDSYVGGVVGWNFYGSVMNCYSTGTVSGNNKVGGVVGDNSGTITDCYSTGTVSGKSNVGGVAGFNSSDSTVTNCYFNSDVYIGAAAGNNEGTVTNVEGKTTAQFASGEVAYLLGEAFGQTIGSQEHPVLGGAKVYYGYISCAEDARMVYTNDGNAKQAKPTHSGSLNYNVNTADSSKHDAVWSCCGTTITESHTYTNGPCVCGAVKTFNVIIVSTSSHCKVSAVNPTAEYGKNHVTRLTFDGEGQEPHYKIGYCYVGGDHDNVPKYTYENGILTIFAESITGDLTFEVQPYYAVTYDGNGGMLLGTETINGEQTYGDRLSVSWVLGEASRDGYQPVSLNTKADGTGIMYEMSDWLTFTEDTTLYIQWECTHAAWTDATCTAPKTCTVCGATEGEKLGHSKPNYTIHEDTHDVDYPCCDTLDSTGVTHEYVDGICACGAEEKSNVVADLKFAGASLTLEDDLTISFKAKQELLEHGGYSDPYAVIVMNGKETVIRDYTLQNGRYVFAFKNVSPNRMSDTVTATLYAAKDGEVYKSAPVNYSAATYCYNMLAKYSDDSNAKLRTLLVDLLNYGAASQLYVDYNTENLVNAALTETQKVWATAVDRELTSVMDQAYATVDNPTVTWKGVSLILRESVVMRFKIEAESVEGLTVKIVNGKETVITTFEETDGGYYVYYDGLHAGQMSEPVYVTVYDGDTAISNTVRYSIESYACAKQTDENTTLADLVKAMMKYGDAARAYAN